MKLFIKKIILNGAQLLIIINKNEEISEINKIVNRNKL